MTAHRRPIHTLAAALLLAALLLPAAASAQKFRALLGHKADVNSVAFSPDGQYVATGSTDRTAILWYAATGEQYKTLTGHTGSINSVSFSPDGKRLATAGSDRTIRVWDVATGTEAKQLNGHKASIEYLSFLPNGQLASASGDGSIRLWDIENNWKQVFQAFENGAYSVSVSPDGKTLAASGADTRILLFDIATGKQLGDLVGHGGAARTVVFSPDGTHAATASLDRTAKIWTVRTGVADHTLTGHTDFVRHITYSPDGYMVATASKDKTARIWDARSGKETLVLNGHTAPLWQVAFSPDGRWLATASSDRTARIWDVSFLNLTPTDLATAGQTKPDQYAPAVDVRERIPQADSLHPNRFALIIANESYTAFQPNLTAEVNVEYAHADGLLFYQYAEKTMGIPSRNILLVKDATAATMLQEMQKMSLMIRKNGPASEIFFYYAGHGIPQSDSKESLLLPVDVSAFQPELAMKLSDALAILTQNPYQRLTVFVDACFSGRARNVSPLAARGVIILPKTITAPKNTVIFSASSADQPALPYRQAKHGLFTYFLLKLLKENPKMGYGELAARLEMEVSLNALLLHNTQQVPGVTTPPELGTRWKAWKF